MILFKSTKVLKQIFLWIGLLTVAITIVVFLLLIFLYGRYGPILSKHEVTRCLNPTNQFYAVFIEQIDVSADDSSLHLIYITKCNEPIHFWDTPVFEGTISPRCPITWEDDFILDLPRETGGSIVKFTPLWGKKVLIKLITFSP